MLRLWSVNFLGNRNLIVQFGVDWAINSFANSVEYQSVQRSVLARRRPSIFWFTKLWHSEFQWGKGEAKESGEVNPARGRLACTDCCRCCSQYICLTVSRM